MILLKKYSGFSLQKWSLQKVSNSSQIIHGSLVGPISVHFMGPWPKQGLRRAPKPCFGFFFFNFEWFSSNSFEWIILLNFPSNPQLNDYFLYKYFGFCFALNHFQARFNENMNFQKRSPTPRSKHIPHTPWSINQLIG